MDQDVVSRKILLLTVIISSSILIFKTISYQFTGTRLHICNRDSYLVALLQIQPDKQVLFYPAKVDAVAECLAQHMPFYDRTIEVIISATEESSILNKINDRYTVGEVVSRGVITYRGGAVKLFANEAQLASPKSFYHIQRKYSKQLENEGYRIILSPLPENLTSNRSKLIAPKSINSSKTVLGVEEIEDGRELNIPLY